MTNMSAQINELAAALAKAQSQIHGAVKDTPNPFFKSKYADLSSVWDACRKPLTDNGLCVIQSTSVENERLYLSTILAHSSGQWIGGTYPIVAVKSDPQSLVAATTYARRAALAAIVGVAPVDDDGETAAGRGHHPEPSSTPKPIVNHAANLSKPGAISGALKDQSAASKSHALEFAGNVNVDWGAYKASPMRIRNFPLEVLAKEIGYWEKRLEKEGKLGDTSPASQFVKYGTVWLEAKAAAESDGPPDDSPPWPNQDDEPLPF